MITTNRYCSTCLVTRTFIQTEDTLQCPVCRSVLVISWSLSSRFSMIRDRVELTRDEEDSRF